MVGDSPPMTQLRAMCELAGNHTCHVLINGESGTGKELIARSIHAAGPRASRPFIAVDCTTLRDTLLESQLFGHVKGAFTGADHSSIGFFRSAHGGTLFLDEIGELDLAVQARFLRCIQERAVVPLGGVDPIPVDVRLLVATHRDLKAMVKAGKFREDLYYRLDVLRLVSPPLRQRGDDVVTLAHHFLDRMCNETDSAGPHLTDDAIRAIRAHSWPGNVRELANAIERAVVVSQGGPITAEMLPEHIRPAAAVAGGDGDGGSIPTLAAAECRLIERALRAAGGNQSRAAEILSIERRRLYRKVKQYRLEPLTLACA